MKKGIDVSHYQKKIDWAKAKKVVEFSILKIGEGRYSNQKDEYFERNYSECKRLGIPVGVYSYAYAQSVAEAKEEAKRVIEWLNGRDLDLPVYYDMENANMQKLGKNQLTEIAIAFCHEIEKVGYWAGIYANLYWYSNLLDTEKLRKMFTLWIAHVDNTYNQNKYDGLYDMFQYSWKGQVDGIIASVDMNVMYRDLVTDVRNSKNATNNIVRKSEDEIVQEIMKGLWGNGEERKQKLQNAGYEYNSIQSKVNEFIRQNSNRKSNEEIAKEIVEKGNWGVGQERIDNLTKAGYNAEEIQKIVNSLMSK
jgi:GH25 family lysozyme M1 (1,4-beta-N-acetylmuramidase)